jgi:hypothetical protein
MLGQYEIIPFSHLDYQSSSGGKRMDDHSYRKPLATVDVSTLSTIPWGPIRQMFPGFVQELELARYLKRILAESPCRAVEIHPHVESDGKASGHVFDVYVQQNEANRFGASTAESPVG